MTPGAPAPAGPNIVPVDDTNEALWARLCHDLWPENPPGEMLAERRAGRLPHEFLAYVAGQPAGFISLSVRREYVEGTNGGPIGYLEGIYVCPAHRRQGVAAAMVAFAEGWARARGCREFASDCYVDNAASRAFHAGVGFAEAGVNVHFVKPL